MSRLVTVLVTLSVLPEADAEDAAALVADAAVSTALEVVASVGVEGHLPVPGSVVQHRRGHQPWRVEAVTPGLAMVSNVAGERVRLPLTVLEPDRLEGEGHRGG